MKLYQIGKYAGLLSGLLAILFMLAGVISFLTGEFLNVIRFSNFFWFATPLLLLGIFGLLVDLVYKEKE
ncbi:MAG: hypothetical protein K9G76_02020 [Bacteroidales bacterium]|nr:hypothetical protein [Bacteroidales bacterium]MCF8405660.1 hypothetical protein [Bacteroidales bacterium]